MKISCPKRGRSKSVLSACPHCGSRMVSAADLTTTDLSASRLTRAEFKQAVVTELDRFACNEADLEGFVNWAYDNIAPEKLCPMKTAANFRERTYLDLCDRESDERNRNRCRGEKS